MKTTKALSIVGVCKVYRRFLFSVARVFAPPNAHTAMKQLFELELNVADLDTAQERKDALMPSHISALPRRKPPYNLDTKT